MKKNLIICHTPLQVLIAKRIIAEQTQSTFHAIMFSYENNAKFRHYFQQLENVCEQSQFIWLRPQQPISYFLALKKLVNGLQISYDTVYCASINSLIVHYLLSHCPFQHLETFDDGTGNILPDSIFYHPPVLSLKQKLLRKCLGVSWDSRKVIANSRLHYTLYPQFDNIVQPTRAVSLISPNMVEHNQSSVPNTEKILLGQPILSDAAENARFFEQIATKFGIRRYFPHPREQQLPDLDIIHSEQIFEDWLIQNISKNTTFELYHLFSTAGLNTAHLPNIRSLAVDIGNLNPRPVPEATCTLFARMGIETIDL
ncbi:glycosyltransferase family 52 [Conchiformibius steedae]|uniref:Alpha-2,3-sialyltransferase n=1 Tax=Conchiformibius steedae TaxID=153493 RepID=A0A3P2ACF2_9NEIS|nr:glycosyltransferase family 52 [Conchiformibius steedae]RRD91313.1 alpha-2,3-sialyltransferase [Conchiformibius steedae]